MTNVAPSYAQRGNPVVAFEGQTIDEMIADYMEEHRVPGMTLAIVQAPYIPRVVGYGVADAEKGLLASPKTLWNVGQMTKAYSAVAIMQLVEADKLRLDDAVATYVENLPEAWQGVTLRQLLAQVSGLPDYTQQPSFEPGRDYSGLEVLALVRDVAPAFAPGTRMAASATDSLLLRLVVERASGMSYQAFVTKHQIERLGLTNTMFASSLASVESDVTAPGGKHHKFLSDRPSIDPTEVATGYGEEHGKRVSRPGSSPGAWLAHGSIYASAEDISLWDIGLAGNLLVSRKENRDFIYHGVVLGDGTKLPANCGWRFPGHKGLMDIRGNVPGFSCYLSRFTDSSELLCVTLCANKEGLDLTELARRIAGAFDRRLGPPVSPKVMRCVESAYPVGTTADRLVAFLESKKINVAARVDHAAAAKSTNLELRPTEVVIFGNPAVGTHLMQSRPSVALDLPLRIVVWQESDGTVWLGTHDIAETAAAHGITDQAARLEAMKAGVAAAMAHASGP